MNRMCDIFLNPLPHVVVRVLFAISGTLSIEGVFQHNFLMILAGLFIGVYLYITPIKPDTKENKKMNSNNSRGD